MRTIKFRGKRPDTMEWAVGSLVECFNGKTGIVSMTKYSEENGIKAIIDEVSPDTIGQYTGMNDKNGKEIYEGDIFKAGYFGEADVVTWDDKNARYIGRSPKGYISYVGREPAVEIIGNIHDNPELLKGGEQ